jgi:formate-dependent nitrite reductase membrane component NrfD
VLYTVMLGLYLWTLFESSASARKSVTWILKGKLAYIFWILVVLVGIIVPLFIFFFADSEVITLLNIGAVFVVLGNLGLRYTIMKSGVYAPLTPSNDI